MTTSSVTESSSIFLPENSMIEGIRYEILLMSEIKLLGCNHSWCKHIKSAEKH
jgi:hypothetical protein